MYDQSFNRKTLGCLLQKRDFLGITTPLEQELFRDDVLNKAIASTNAGLGITSNPFIGFSLQGKIVFMFSNLSDELISRKLCENLKMTHRRCPMGRTQIVSNLSLLLEEGVPFRIYRLDIKSFYESFQLPYVISSIEKISRLSPQSKKLVKELLTCHIPLGGQGIPRGLSLSAILSDLLMHGFDQSVQSNDDVFFYSRYVDDIIVVTSSRENVRVFLSDVEKFLPPGLTLNQAKRQIVTAKDKVNPTKSSGQFSELFSFDYLGYAFSVKEPVKDNKTKDYYRSVTVDIAAKKIMRFKTRISRSFLDFSKTGNFDLLKDRIKLLTKNFSVYNAKAGGKKIAGIFHSYPLVSGNPYGLKTLDNFLRNAVLSKNGRMFSKYSLTAHQKQNLLAHSFTRGHAEKCFVHFSGVRLKEIQECWKN